VHNRTEGKITDRIKVRFIFRGGGVVENSILQAERGAGALDSRLPRFREVLLGASYIDEEKER
jgi:hypothetical protein